MMAQLPYISAIANRIKHLNGRSRFEIETTIGEDYTIIHVMSKGVWLRDEFILTEYCAVGAMNDFLTSFKDCGKLVLIVPEEKIDEFNYESLAASMINIAFKPGADSEFTLISYGEDGELNVRYGEERTD